MNASACPRCVDHRIATFHIAEMDCAHEVTILQSRVGSLAGVVTLEADVLSRQIRVHFDGTRLAGEQIAEAVAQAGMRAWPVTSAAAPPRVETGVPWMIVAASLACAAAGVLWLAYPHDLWIRTLLALSILMTAPATGRRAWQALRGRRLDIHVLMSVAVIGAVAIDEWFEAATVLVLFGVAQALEARSMARARRAISEVLTVAPPTADVSRAGTIDTVPVEQVTVGAAVSVRPGARVPLDGTVTSGESTVDQAPVTGESMPVRKAIGDDVYAGSVNGDGALTFEVTRLAADSTVARIVHLVERAHAGRAQVQSTVDRFAAIYTPIVLTLAALIAVGPPLFAGAAWHLWIERALVLLVVACPCALVIATPVAMVSALSAAARRGLLLKGGAVLERLAAVRVVALDKTGTVSEGRLAITGAEALGAMAMDEALQLAASVEARVHHPLADAIVARARAAGQEPRPVT
ncbi:MAG: heavy metal translocating P-type ATPase, partial [Acidobacteria bacterium]|nr:heavy metal translocating P-type ATPase [Acidobacteriota bacterium]